MTTKTCVLFIALTLGATTLPVPDLANLLNRFGCRTISGAPYLGGRGTYALISKTYRSLILDGRPQDAAIVARAFTKPNGQYAY
jgi:hypothetical protein